MTRRFFSGSSLDQAVMMAARHYGVDPAELAYRQIEKRHGFLRTRKAVMIAVDPEQPRRTPGAADASGRLDASGARTAAEPTEHAAESGPGLERQPEAREDERPEADARDEGWERAAAPEPETREDERPEAGARDESWEQAAAPEPEAAEDERREPAAGDDDRERPYESEPEAREDERFEAEARDEDWRQHDEPEPAAQEAAVAEPAAPEEAALPAAEADPELLEAAERAAHKLLGFAGIEAEAKAGSVPERIEVEIDGPDASLLVVESGKGLLAIQHLLPRMMRGMTGRSSFVRADSRGFHRKRRERLQALAVKEAEVVSRNGTPRTLPPMAPDERRIVHLAVQEIPTVVTESRGSGLHKRVVIRPAAADGGHDDIEARHGF